MAVALAEAKAALKRKEEAEVPWCLGRFIQEIWNFDDFRCLQTICWSPILNLFRSFLNVDLFKYVRDDWSNPSPGFETQNNKQGKWGYIQQFWEYSVTEWGWVKSLLSHDCGIDIHQHQLSCEPAMGTRVLTISWGETALSHTEFRLRPDLCDVLRKSRSLKRQLIDSHE